jgi:two-component system chemotaxis response regulator CheB
MPIKVLVVDDSAVMRGLLSQLIDSQPDLEVVGAAHDALMAREKIKALNPDVLTLDVEMPRMDGLTFLEKLMRLRPMPVVMVSSRTKGHALVTLRALELGAVDFIAKPQGIAREDLQEFGETIAEKIRAAANAKLNLVRASSTSQAPLPALRLHSNTKQEKLIVIGASTGGTDAIKEVLIRMPEDAPGTLIVQHMPETFTRMFADRLNDMCRVEVKEAVDGERVLLGHAYIAPGHSHMQVARSHSSYIVRLNQQPPVNRHRPSVDVLFRSAAASAGRHAIGIVLTGMGADGAEGIRALKQAGAYNLAQNQASCIVYGMPKAAIETDCIDKVASLKDITSHVVNYLDSTSQ